MNSKSKEDLDGLCNYIFEHEYEDMLDCLIEEPLYLEEGIITEEEVMTLVDCSSGGGMTEEEENKVGQIVEKCSKNPNNLHVYALALRLYYDVVKG